MFVLTQIHKCKRSVNRLFKGYLLIIYMKRRSEIFWCWACRLNHLIKLRWFLGMAPIYTHNGELHLEKSNTAQP